MKDKIEYDDATHEYKIGDKKVPSVTELATEFSKLNKEYFKAHPEYAARGTAVHQELQEYLEGTRTVESLSDLAQEIAAYITPTKDARCEAIVYNTTLGYAGTADIIMVKGTTVGSIVDIKTGRNRNTLYERCQLSLYLLALKDMGYNTDETMLYVLCPDGYVKYQPLTWEQMKELECGDLTFDSDDESMMVQRKIEHLKMLEQFVEDYKNTETELKELLCGMFEKKQATTFAYDGVRFSYTKPSVRKSVDTAAMKKAGVYDQFVKETAIPAGVRITKGKTDDK